MKGKKLLLSLAAFGLLAGLVGCNNNRTESKESKESQQSSVQPSSSVEPASSSEPASSVESSSPAQSSSAAQVQLKVAGADGAKKITGIGKTLQLSATANNEAVAGITWASADTTVATVDSNGLVTSVAKGSTKITADKDGYKQGSLTITVDLEKIVISSEGGVNKVTGLNQTLQLSASLNDQPLQGVTWASKNTDVATVSASGLVTSVAKGSANITASLEPYAEATFSFTVELEQIAVTAADNKVELLMGETVQLSANKDGVEWKTSNADMLTVSNTGLVTANSNKKYGTATISAEKAGFDAGTIEIKVNRPAPTATLHMEDADHYSADGVWGTSYGSTMYGPGDTPVYARDSGNASDGQCIAYMANGDSETLSFSSSAAVKAELVLMMASRSAVSDLSSVMAVKFNNNAIDLAGKEFAGGGDTNTFIEFSFGEVDLIAGTNTLQFDFTGSSPYMDDLKIYAESATNIAIVSKDPVVVNQESLTVKEGKTVAITSSMDGLSYKSANTAVATVNESGVVTGVKAGATTIAVSKDGYKTIRVPVTVEEADGVFAVSINAGTSEGSVVTFRTSQNLSEPYNYIVDAFPANAVLSFTIDAPAAGSYNLYMRCRASGGYNSTTTDDLATCMEVKVNDVAVAATGTVSGSSFTDYLIGEVTLVAGANNTLTIKCLTAVPTANLLRFVPKA